jgi:hypothetical protein
MAMRYYAPFPGGGSDPARPRVPHAMRIGDAERDAAAADLGEHYAAGRLTLDELHERLEAAFSAKTFGQLAGVMADLPGARSGWPAAAPGWQPAPSWVPAAGPRPGPPLYGGGWGPAGLRYQGPLEGVDGPWHPDDPAAGFSRRELPEPPIPSDRAGRLAALSLLLLAMLIWLFTALLFARHGVYHSGPFPGPGSIGHYYPGTPGSQGP